MCATIRKTKKIPAESGRNCFFYYVNFEICFFRAAPGIEVKTSKNICDVVILRKKQRVKLKIFFFAPLVLRINHLALLDGMEIAEGNNH